MKQGPNAVGINEGRSIDMGPAIAIIAWGSLTWLVVREAEPFTGWVVAIAIFALLLGQTAFRTQRVALNLARSLSEHSEFGAFGPVRLHGLLTPGWAGLMDWTGKLLTLGIAAALWHERGWTWGLGYLVGIWLVSTFVGAMAGDFLWPVPSIDGCFSAIEASAQQKARRIGDPVVRRMLEVTLVDYIRECRAGYVHL